mmetsp:Transcript_1641/g.3101  ORF Transcript_1641/g.3101 Transcript_1641/m.3101 type:complete len:85 (+) Transcript_1641:941-1195(+)
MTLEAAATSPTTSASRTTAGAEGASTQVARCTTAGIAPKCLRTTLLHAEGSGARVDVKHDHLEGASPMHDAARTAGQQACRREL